MMISPDDRKRTIYSVVEADLDYDDEYYSRNGEGYILHESFEDLEEAREQARFRYKQSMLPYSVGDICPEYNGNRSLEFTAAVEEVANHLKLAQDEASMFDVVENLEKRFGDKWIKYVPELVWVVKTDFIERIDPEEVEKKVAEIKGKYS